MPPQIKQSEQHEDNGVFLETEQVPKPTPAATKVNNLTPDVLLYAKAKMEDDQSFGAACKIEIQAEWSKGVVSAPKLGLVAHAPPQVAVGAPQEPSIWSYMPGAVAGGYSLQCMMEAAKEGMSFVSHETTVTSKMDVTPFFKAKQPKNPYADGMEMQVAIQGPQSKAEMEELAEVAKANCPLVEVMNEFYEVWVGTTGMKVEVTDDKPYYDIDKYKALAASEEPILVDQTAVAQWNCGSVCTEHPLQILYTHDGYEATPLIGSGQQPNPVQSCFFGTLASHMHVMAIRLVVRGYRIEFFSGRFTTTMNTRKAMGVTSQAYAFSEKGQIDIKIESNAPHSVIRTIGDEATKMSPAYLAMSGLIKVNMNIVKVGEE